MGRLARTLGFGLLCLVPVDGHAETYASSVTHRRVGAPTAVPLVPERPLIALGTEYALRERMVSRAEVERLRPALRRAHDEMASARGDVPSALLRSLSEQESAAGFDVIEIQPTHGPARAAVVFLHGSGGAFTLMCHQMAAALAPLPALTVCPATDWRARWTDADGRAIVEQTLTDLERRGFDTVILAGLSSGGFGATGLAPRVADRIDGLVAISGARGRPARGVPTLVVHGTRDRRVAYKGARAYARRAGATLVTLQDDHWAFLLSAGTVADPIRAFVAELLDK